MKDRQVPLAPPDLPSRANSTRGTLSPTARGRTLTSPDPGPSIPATRSNRFDSGPSVEKRRGG
ncbi:hypothetical protein GCM10010151_31080 [Actinoallomurus spadix]|uniref:Uncharacterized protein n=1 Tax=Actinoallomurus spadix TaxID=79912 RepID=A0ABN0WJ97_9ACTN